MKLTDILNIPIVIGQAGVAAGMFAVGQFAKLFDDEE